MSSLARKSLINSCSALFLQVFMVPLNFLLRVLLLRYVGIEVIGLSSTLASLVSFLSLAEGGVGTAISYCLYKPLVEKDTNKINAYLMVFKRIYTVLAVFVLVAGAVLSLFIPYIITGMEINAFVYIVFFLECANASISYLLCYRRTLLGADMKAWVANNVDMVCNGIFISVGLFVVYLTHDYILYLIVIIIKTITSNIVIHKKCDRIYPYLHKTTFNRDLFDEVLSYAKNLFVGNIGAFVFNSTDNIVISMATSTVNVGYLSNYNMITNYLRSFSVAALSGVTPAIGQKQVKSTLNDKIIMFGKYRQICYLLALFVAVPAGVLLDYFVVNVYGSEYLMSQSISVLLVMILYLYLVPTPYGTYVITNGAFAASKRADMVAATTNLSFSLLFVYLYGLPGVLLGTVVSMFFAWLVRADFVFKNILQLSRKKILLECGKEVYLLLIMFTAIGVSGKLSIHIATGNFVINFLMIAILAEVVSFSLYCLCYRFHDRLKPNEVIGKFKKR